MAQLNDGRVTVLEAGTNIEVRLYPIDARQAVAIGSHVWPKGRGPVGPEGEIAELRRQNAELLAKLSASLPGPTDPDHVANLTKATPAPAASAPIGAAARMTEAAKQADAVGSGASKP